jgi:amino acid efflux transporter
VVGIAGGKFIALIGVLIVAANLNGATWGFSRLVMACARTGFLPPVLAKVNEKSKVPGNAVMATTALILLVLSLYVTRIVSLSTLLQLAGQNFFILYFLCVTAFVKQARGFWLRSIGIVLTVLYLFRVVSYQLELVYPLILISSGIALFYLGNLRRGNSLT